MDDDDLIIMIYLPFSLWPPGVSVVSVLLLWDTSLSSVGWLFSLLEIFPAEVPGEPNVLDPPSSVLDVLWWFEDPLDPVSLFPDCEGNFVLVLPESDPEV